MSDTPEKRSLWVRALLMILLAMAFYLAATLLAALALVQFVLVIVSDGPNERLNHLGRGLGRYFRQLTDFLSFASEEAPFPFSDWPAAD